MDYGHFTVYVASIDNRVNNESEICYINERNVPVAGLCSHRHALEALFTVGVSRLRFIQLGTLEKVGEQCNVYIPRPCEELTHICVITCLTR
jgi:hypothetical protein